MRCVSCQLEGVTGSRCCECCGNELSSYQIAPQETETETSQADDAIEPVAEPDPPAPQPEPVVQGNCETCGAPTVDGVLCSTCQQSFDSWLGSAESSPAAEHAAAAPAPSALWTPPAPSNPTVLMPTLAAVGVAQTEAVLPAPAPVPVLSAAGDLGELREQPGQATARHESSNAGAAKVEAARSEPPLTEPIRIPSALKAAAAGPPVAAPAAEPSRPAASAPPKSTVAKKEPGTPAARPRRGLLALAAAAVVVAGIAGGVVVLRMNQPAAATPVQQQPPEIVAQAVEPPKETGKPAVHKETPAPAVAPPAAAPQAPRNAATRPQTPAKAARPVTAAPEEAAPPLASKAPVAPPPPEAAPPVAEVVPPPAPASPAAPVGPFFETTDVNEAPQVAKRVEPQMPEELRGRPVNEILVVRILVSQSGHPFRVSLLRRSKAGPSLDSAVIAAVNRWAFQPAKRRGEPVSCWLNMGVPVGQSN